MISDADISYLGQLIINDLGSQLIKQQHRSTGDLIGSLDYRISRPHSGFVLEILMNDYGLFVDSGRRKGAKKVPIQSLLEWIKQKGIETNNKKALGIAFAIQKTIQKEGSPTRNSRAKGKRTGFINDTLIRVSNEIDRLALDFYGKQVESQIDKFIKAV